MACETNKFVGRVATVEYVIGCGDVMPAEDDWKVLGACRSKTQSFNWDTVDATADDTVGNTRDTLATWLNYELSVDGVCRKDEAANQVQLEDHFISPTETGGQPIALFRITTPSRTTICAMLMSEYSLEYPNDDVATWSLTASVTNSVIGLVRTPTPVVPDPTGP